MNENHGTDNAAQESTFSRQVGAQAARKLKARRDSPKSIWFGLGMSGLIGWSVTVPTLVGAAIGIWADRRHPSHYSWTLMLLLTGLIIGCLNAWHWVDSEYREMQEDSDE
jgi:ATP synthase protein I